MSACAYCGEPVDPDGPHTFRRCVGWERKAVAGSRRGGSDIVLREPVDEYACWTCIDRRKRGIAPSQEALL